MDFDEEEMGDDFKAEVKAYERVGHSGKLSELLTIPMEELGKKTIISGEDRFLINTDAFCRRINEERITKLSQGDINIMLEKAVNIVGLRYKNFVAYVLGYIASNGGKDFAKVEYVLKNVLPMIGDEGGVTAPDVIRYARFWNKI